MFPFQGATGRPYDYLPINTENPGAIPMSGGLFIFAESTLREPRVVYVGEADSIYGTIINTTLWNIARRDHRADSIYVHLLKDQKARRAEQTDLVARYQPTMNLASC